MSLRVTDLQLHNFRSYRSFSLSDLGELTVLYGPNAAGKTNVIEALQLLTALSSFRTTRAQEFVNHEAEQARIQATLSDGSRQLTVRCHIREGKRTYEVNGKPRTANKLRTVAPAITFSPEDLSMVKGADAARRAEVDQLGAQLNQTYAQVLRDFQKVLRQRNQLLKDESPDLQIDALSDVFAQVGARLLQLRGALIQRLRPHLQQAYEQIAALEHLGVQADCPGPSTAEDATATTAALLQQLAGRRAEERARKTTLVGPHRQKLTFELDELDAARFASQGQQRSIVLALKIAEVHVIEDILQQKPILLLDDVMSELDASRRQAIIERLLPDTQTFITTAHLDYFENEILQNARIVDIKRENMA